MSPQGGRSTCFTAGMKERPAALHIRSGLTTVRTFFQLVSVPSCAPYLHAGAHLPEQCCPPLPERKKVALSGESQELWSPSTGPCPVAAVTGGCKDASS